MIYNVFAGEEDEYSVTIGIKPLARPSNVDRSRARNRSRDSPFLRPAIERISATRSHDFTDTRPVFRTAEALGAAATTKLWLKLSYRRTFAVIDRREISGKRADPTFREPFPFSDPPPFSAVNGLDHEGS